MNSRARLNRGARVWVEVTVDLLLPGFVELLSVRVPKQIERRYERHDSAPLEDY